MIIKKFTAPTMTEALAKVREELGSDAIILNTRSEKKGGVMDLIGRSVVEVTAAIDDKPVNRTGTYSGTARRESRGGSIGPRDATPYPPENPGIYNPPAGTALTQRTQNVNIRDLDAPVKMDRMMAEINMLKQSISELADSALTHDMDGLPVHLSNLLKRMNDSGLNGRISKRLIRQLLNELDGAAISDPLSIRERAVELLLSGIGQVSPILFTGAKPRIVVFAGPTGSGKTTTIAKLATEFSINMDKKVTVLTIDTKRVDAVGQLKAYCRIINIPLFIAYSPDDIAGIMPGIMESDITLVDTPGSGPMDKQQMLDMVEFLQKLVPQEVHLTISITTSYKEMNRIKKNFGILKPNRLLFTKLDESDSYGAMLSFALVSKKPLSYMTFGQNVPGDFNVINPRKIVENVLELKEDGKDK